MPNVFDINALVPELENQALTTLKSLGITAAVDVAGFVAGALPALTRYTNMYLGGSINADEFSSLVNGIKDLATLEGLTVAGLSAEEIQKTRSTFLNVASSFLLGAIGKLV